MAYVAPTTRSVGDAVTAADYNIMANDVIDHETRINDSGLVIITPTSVSGSGVTSSNGKILVSSATTIGVNGVFSSAYDNYQVLIELESSNATAVTTAFRLAASGTANSTAGNYYYASSGHNSQNTGVTTASSTSGDSFILAASGSGLGKLGIAMNLFNPFAAQRTSYTAIYSYFNTSTTFFTNNSAGGMTVTTAYDGFTISLGTLSGQIRVYGYTPS